MHLAPSTYGIDVGQAILWLFVGRIARQKGCSASGAAIQFMDRDFPIGWCTPHQIRAIGRGKRIAVVGRSASALIIWIDDMVDQQLLCEFYSHAAVFRLSVDLGTVWQLLI